MSTPVEITVTLKNEHVTFKKKFLEYGAFVLCVEQDEGILMDYINKTKAEFSGDVSEVIVTTRMQVQ